MTRCREAQGRLSPSGTTNPGEHRLHLRDCRDHDSSRDVLHVFGRVPLFFYVLHLPLITQTADSTIRATRGVWPSAANFGSLRWGYELPVVYALWLVLLVVLYPACRWFAGVKARRRDWWLGYL